MHLKLLLLLIIIIIIITILVITVIVILILRHDAWMHRGRQVAERGMPYRVGRECTAQTMPTV